MAQVKETFYGSIRRFRGTAAWKVVGHGKTRHERIKQYPLGKCAEYVAETRYLINKFTLRKGLEIKFIAWI